MKKMINKFGLGFLIFSISLLFTYNFGHGTTEIDEFIEEVKEASNSINSYKVNYILKIKKEGGEVRSRGHIEYEEPKKFYMELGLSELQGMKQIFVSDGKEVWQYIPEMKEVTRINLNKVESKKVDEYLNKRGDIREPFENLKKDSIEILSQTSDGKEKLYIIKAEPKSEIKRGAIVGVDSVKIWINSSQGIPKKIVWYNSSGDAVIRQEFKDIELNPEIKDSRFDFTPPENVEVIDVTDQVK